MGTKLLDNNCVLRSSYWVDNNRFLASGYCPITCVVTITVCAKWMKLCKLDKSPKESHFKQKQCMAKFLCSIGQQINHGLRLVHRLGGWGGLKAPQKKSDAKIHKKSTKTQEDANYLKEPTSRFRKLRFFS